MSRSDTYLSFVIVHQAGGRYTIKEKKDFKETDGDEVGRLHCHIRDLKRTVTFFGVHDVGYINDPSELRRTEKSAIRSLKRKYPNFKFEPMPLLDIEGPSPAKGWLKPRLNSLMARK